MTKYFRLHGVSGEITKTAYAHHINQNLLTECFCRLAASPCSVLWPSVVSSVFFRITHSINSRSDSRMPFQWSLLDSRRLLLIKWESEIEQQGNSCRWVANSSSSSESLCKLFWLLSLIGFKFTVSRCSSTSSCSTANSSRPGAAGASPRLLAR